MMSRNVMYPPKRGYVEHRYVQVRKDGSRHVDTSHLKSSRKVKEQVQAIENTRDNKAAKQA